MKFSFKAAGCGIVALTLLLGRYPISWLLSNGKSNKRALEKKFPYYETYVKSPTGNTLFVRIQGSSEKPTLVLIHGINSNGQQWQEQQRFFCNDYRLLMIDLPGHGASPDAVDLSINALALDLSSILAQLKIPQPILHGHSLGGMIIQEYCIRNYSPHPKAIILQNCSYTNPLKTTPISPIPWLLQRPLINPVLNQICRHSRLFTALGYLAYTSGMSSIFYRVLLFSGKQNSATLRKMAWFAARTSAKTTSGMLMKAFDFDAGNSPMKIEVSCLVIGAVADRLVDPTACWYLQKQIPGSKLVMVEGGHQTLVEYPEATNQAVQRFLLNLPPYSTKGAE